MEAQVDHYSVPYSLFLFPIKQPKKVLSLRHVTRSVTKPTFCFSSPAFFKVIYLNASNGQESESSINQFLSEPSSDLVMACTHLRFFSSWPHTSDLSALLLSAAVGSTYHLHLYHFCVVALLVADKLELPNININYLSGMMGVI